ncbi:hypothetical protein M569_00518, partial [Genlisea aurea]
DNQGIYPDYLGSPDDLETKERFSADQRAGRTVKKHRHGDMAYEGDIDWEVLMQSQEFFLNNQILGKSRDKMLSSSAGMNSENGKAAAVRMGLRARRIGALEKIKFKEALKRKGGPQEYLKCRNYILGFWNNNVSRIVSLKDFGVSDTPMVGEDQRDSQIRDIYIFLDQYGYINYGVPTEKEMKDNCMKQEEYLTQDKSIENIGLSLSGHENGVSFLFESIHHGETIGSKDFSSLSSSCIVEIETVVAGPNPDSLPPDLAVDESDCPPVNGFVSDILGSECVHADFNFASRKNIIVVGAGPAGLVAARHLQRHGFSVTVLEARSRIGGRVYTDRKSFSVPVDLGASIITGVEADVAGERRPDPSSLICAQLGLELTVLNSECPLYDTMTGQKVPSDLDEAFEAEYNSLLDDMVMLATEKGDHANKMSLGAGLEYGLQKRSMSHSEKSNIEKTPIKLKGTSLMAQDCLVNKETPSALDSVTETLSPLERRVMDWHFAHLEYGCAALLEDVSLPNWNQDDVYGGFGGAHCMIKGGYSAVVEALGEGICIHLNHAVNEISYQSQECEKRNCPNKNVRVSTLNGKEFSADAVLVTVPLGCLKAESIKFAPPLPQWKHLSIKRLGFGVLNKVVMEFPAVFWDDSIDYFGATADDTDQRGWCFMFWNLKKTVGAPVLIALVVGKAAIDGQNTASDHLIHALLVLRKLFGDSNVPEPVAFFVTDWGKDPYSYGAYSYVAVGSSGEDYDILGKPVENCVFFAGEATCKEHPDTVGGAMMSGLREAVRIIDILNDGTDCIAEAEAMEAARRNLDIQRSEVKDIINQLDSTEFTSDSYKQSSDRMRVSTWGSMLKDMFYTAKTTAGRLRLAKELLNLPAEFLKTSVGTKEGLSILNSWILDSMGKDGTQLLRHCVRLLLRVSNDLLAVRLSGIGKTIKENVCVHTSRDIRSIASQLVSVWVDLFRKEKAKRGSIKNLGHLSSKNRSLLAARKPNAGVHHGTKVDAMEENHEVPISEEEKAALAAAEEAHAAAVAAAEAYAASGLVQKSSVKPPKILSFQKFADQHAHMDESDCRKNWHGSGLGKQDYLSEMDSWTRKVRDWAVDFSATCVDLGSSKALANNYSQQSHSSDVACQLQNRENSGESVALDSSMLTKAWVDSAGGNSKDYNAIERWQCQAAAASSGFSHGTGHKTHEEDSTMSSKSRKQKQDHPSGIESSASQVATSRESKGNHGRGSESMKHAVVDYVASLLMPLYKARKIDREGYKSIMKKAATKVVEQASDSERAMPIFDFLDSKRKNKIRAFVDLLIERHMAQKPGGR